jgi:hypothetical protein
MPKNPVYSVSVDFSKAGIFEQAVRKNAELRAQIFDLALKENEEVYFHRYIDNVTGGAPQTLVECSEDFHDKIKKLPLYGESRELDGGMGTFRAGHAGAVDRTVLKRLLAQETKDPSLAIATWRLQDEILDLSLAKGIGGEVLIRHIDADRGFISLLCPDTFVPEIEKLERCRAIVKPEDAAKIFHKRGPGPRKP